MDSYFSDPFAYPEFADPEEFLKQPYGTNANQIAGNYIGVKASGTAAAGNGLGGVLIDNAAAYTIVGPLDAPLETQWWGNVISANGGPGVEIAGRGTAVNVLGGNLIGLSADGETGLGNAGPGVRIHDQPVATNIGGDIFNANLGSRNYIADNDGPGILIEDVYDLGRAVVTDPAPGQEIGDPVGQLTDPLTGDHDVAAWNTALGVGTNYYETVIASNWIGLGVEFETGIDPETEFVIRVGFTPIPLGNNGDGVLIVDSSNIDIGGAHPGWTKNTIAANDGHGVHISGDKSFLNFIKQAHIGTDPTGTSDSNAFGSFANTGDGAHIDGDAHHNLIDGTGIGVDFFSVQHLPSIEHGGNGAVDLAKLRAGFDVADSGVVISNNGGNGVVIDGAHWNQVGGGTYIGTNLGGTAALGNTGDGISITGGATLNQVGPRGARIEQQITYDENDDIVPGAIWFDVIVPLIVSGNLGAGIMIEGNGTDDNSIKGALIGAGYDEEDLIGLGNDGPGVLIRDGATENLVDEIELVVIHEPVSPEDPPDVEAVKLKNIIVANGTIEAPRAGIEITGAGTSDNQVYNSHIDANPNDLTQTNLGNTGDGVLVTASASENLIGDEGAGNTIAKNTGRGVAIVGKNQVIEGWDVDGNGYLMLTLASLDGIEVSKTYKVTGFTLRDDEENSQAVEQVTVASIDVPNLTIHTNVLVTLPGMVDAEFSEASFVEINKPKLNVIAGNWIGTDEEETELGNLGDGVLVTASATENWVTANEISFNGGHGVALTAGVIKNDVGIRMVSNVITGGANTITHNALDGVLISGSTENSVWDNLIAHNDQHGVDIRDTKNTRKNSVLGNEITDNAGYGVLIANGAEGNGIGVHIGESPAPYQRPIAIDATDGNTITGNEGGFQVRIEGSSAARTQYNFVSGYNEIEGHDGASAVSIDGGEGNVIGNGGEGQGEAAGQDFVVGQNPTAYRDGNLIAYEGQNAYGIEITGNGGEGNAVIGNAFVGDLENAILLSGYTGLGFAVAPPVISDVSFSGSGPVSLGIETTVAEATSARHVRVDYYLVNPNDFEETIVLGHRIFDSPTAATFNPVLFTLPFLKA